MDLDKVGNFIAMLRADKGLTQVQLGEMLGVENKTISKWENSTNAPDITMLIALSNIFDVRVEEIVDGEYKEKYREEENRSEITQEHNKYKKHNKIKVILLNLLVVI